MRAIDTNVLVRLIARDDRKQADRADAFVAAGAWVSHLVLAETMWVLVSVYGLRRKEIGAVVEMLQDHAQLTLQDAEVVDEALEAFRGNPRIDFSDALIIAIAHRNGHAPLGSFDRDLSRLTGVETL